MKFSEINFSAHCWHYNAFYLKSKSKKKVYNTGDSQVVTNQSTNAAQQYNGTKMQSLKFFTYYTVEKILLYSKFKRRVYNTQVVTHQSTNPAQRCLTSVIRWEMVLSVWYGHRHLNMQLKKNLKSTAQMIKNYKSV